MLGFYLYTIIIGRSVLQYVIYTIFINIAKGIAHVHDK